MHRLIFFFLLFFYGCGNITPSEALIEEKDDAFQNIRKLGQRFISDREFRRNAFVESLVNPENTYSKLRLNNYSLVHEGWDNLKIWNPDTRIFSNESSKNDYKTFAEIDFNTISEKELIAYGKRAFERYPVSVDLTLPRFIKKPSKIGMWTEQKTGRVGGLVELKLKHGDEYAQTCSTCHVSNVEGELVYGRSNSDFDYGKAIHSDWRPGTVDVTSDNINNPASIPDIRALRYQKYIHWNATLVNTLVALAIRIETLIITSLSKRLRPPRHLAFALAYYFWSLGSDTRPPDKSLSGFTIFEENCAQCHHLDGSTSEPIPLNVIKTDSSVGESTERGTGKYRIPSLYGVSTRGIFLHDGSVNSLMSLLSRERLSTTPGHLFGLELLDTEKKELIEFLDTL